MYPLCQPILTTHSLNTTFQPTLLINQPSHHILSPPPHLTLHPYPSSTGRLKHRALSPPRISTHIWSHPLSTPPPPPSPRTTTTIPPPLTDVGLLISSTGPTRPPSSTPLYPPATQPPPGLVQALALVFWLSLALVFWLRLALVLLQSCPAPAFPRTLMKSFYELLLIRLK